MKKLCSLSLLATLGLFSMGCHRTENKKVEIPDSTVLVLVENSPITMADYRRQYQVTAAKAKGVIPREIFEIMVLARVVAILGKRAGLDKSPEYLKVSDSEKENWFFQKYLQRHMKGKRLSAQRVAHMNDELLQAKDSMKIEYTPTATELLNSSSS